MDPKAQMKSNARLDAHIHAALADFQNFVVSEMIHTWMDAQPEGTLDRFVATWRATMEARFADAAQARMQASGLIQPTQDAEKLVLDLTIEAIYGVFAGEIQTNPPSDPEAPDDQPKLVQ